MSSDELRAVIGGGLAAGLALLRWGLSRRRSDAPTAGLWRWISAHLDREYQHARTVQRLWQEEEETESQARQIAIMEARIEGLLDQLRDASYASSRGRSRLRAPSRRPTNGDLTGSTGASPSRRRE